MTEYKVQWEIDIEAATPREAAEKALEIQRDPDSVATVFKVIHPASDESRSWTDVDLGEPDEEVKPLRKAQTFEMTEEEFREATNDHEGRCINCGEEAGPVEPDARKYKCEACLEKCVYGLEELLMMGLVEFT